LTVAKLSFSIVETFASNENIADLASAGLLLIVITDDATPIDAAATFTIARRRSISMLLLAAESLT
jgi:hypothetical protein